MAEYTTNKKLELPKSNEKYDVAVANKNNMVIDSELNKLDLKNQSQDSTTTQIQNSLNDHKNSVNNPHNVTKTQIGLNNVDNTSDIEKPVSNAQQEFVSSTINFHNESELSHSDIREILLDLSTRLNTLADSDDETLDQLSEIVAYIKNNKTLIDGITTSKVSVADIINTIDLLQANTVPGKIVDALLIKEVFQYVSDGKSAIASAITDKGVTTDALSTFSIMAQNIRKIKDNSNMTLSSITVSPPTKSIYQVGETLDLSGAIVTAIYESTDDVTQSAIYSPVDGEELTLAGNVTISVSYTDGEITKTTETSVVVSGLKIVTWADGTDEEIAAMLDAHYNGEIDIYDYWHIGDERTVHLSAIPEEGKEIYNFNYENQPTQDISFVLMHYGGMKLSEPINDKTTCAFVVGQKNCLKNSGKLNEINSSVLLDNDRIKWLNSLYKEALPTTFLALFKKHYKFGAVFEGNSHKIYQYTNFLFWLPSEYNIFGTITNSSDLEESYQFQFEYYKDKTKIPKTLGNEGIYTEYWTSSIAYDSDKYKRGECTVLSNGDASYKMATKCLGISPIGCI